MRITRQTLLKIARDTVRRRTSRPRNVLAAYLCGSLVNAEPLLGGTADIDLVFVYNAEPPAPREVERLTDEVHLDIAHHPRSTYRRGRLLREDPWLGPTLYHCLILHDPQHFLDFTQAAVRGLYHRPESILARARQFSDAARQVWLDFYAGVPEVSPEVVVRYLNAVGDGANAVASLTGPPLAERRLLLGFPERAADLGRSGLEMAVIGLLGGTRVEDAETLRGWLSDWGAALQAAGKQQGTHVRLHPHRRLYYLNAVEALLDSGQPLAGLWPVIRTWTQAVAGLPPTDPVVTAWQAAAEQLQLIGPAFSDRVDALDAFLDTVEETLEDWGRQQGVTEALH